MKQLHPSIRLKRATVAIGRAKHCLRRPSLFVVLALVAVRYSHYAKANIDQSDAEHTISLERKNGSSGEPHHVRRSRITPTNMSPSFNGGSNLTYFPMWREGGYCDDDPSKLPEPGLNNQIKFFGTLAECCEASFTWMKDNTYLSNSQKILHTEARQEEMSDPLTTSTIISKEEVGQAETMAPEGFTKIEINSSTTSPKGSSSSTMIDQVGENENKSNPAVSVNSTANPVPLSVGKEGCLCMDVSSVLSSLHERSCQISKGQLGVVLTVKGPCVPHSYGSSVCLRHDALHDPKCKVAGSGDADMPNYCFRKWCYVDAISCRQSSERVFRSDHFARDEGVDMFYSYSTCGSTDKDWIHYKDEHSLDGTIITAIVPTYTAPIMYKRSPTGEILTSEGAEYYDSSVRYEGAFMDYLDNLREITSGRLHIDYTFGSEAGRRVHPTSKYTASIQDIADGLADMAIGRFWITAQRLKLISFTMPLYYDKTVLVIPKPDDNSSLNAQTQNVLQPFTLAVWALILLLIFVTALLSVWFTTHGREFRQAKRERLKKAAYARVSLDEFLQAGIFFCSAGVEQDSETSLPQKLLMFGFSFFILIVVSTYVANLAAFLTQPAVLVGTIDAANKKGSTVCAHPVLETELRVAHPTMNFLFSKGGYNEMIQDYKERKCDFLAVGKGDIVTDVDRAKAFCDSGLVITDSLFIEIPVAFPIRPDLASSMSYWMHLGEKNHGITFQAALKDYLQPKCKLEFSPKDLETSDYAQIHPENFFFPFMFFLGFALMAVILQLYHQRALKKGNQRSLVGRPSSLGRRRSGLFRGVSERFDSSRRFDVNELDDQNDDERLSILDDQNDDKPLSNEIDVSHDNANDIEHTGCKKRAKFLGVNDNASLDLNERDDFNDNELSNNLVGECVSISSGEQRIATSRLQLLVETGAFDAFDDILECVQDIKRQGKLTPAKCNID